MLPPNQLLMCTALSLCLWQMLHLMSGADGRQNSNHESTRYRTGVQQLLNVDVKDKILELQCYARCEGGLTHKYSDANICREECKLEIVKLPRRGNCPNLQNAIFLQNSSPLQRLSCLDNCSYDYDCPEIQKCCDSSCGPVCTDAKGVSEDSLLPPIPKLLRYKLPRGHKVEITIQSSANSTYYCHVEARYHIGVLFSPRKLGMWQWQFVEKIAEISDSRSKRTDISFNLQSGRWYQVRVAAINAYGFRGYSEPSKAFSLPNHPKPPKAPTDMKVAAIRFDGTHYSIRIVWCPSKSNLPIEKYKVIWSLYVKSKDESFISHEAYVKDAHQFEINKLLPDSSYYIQVQALSISGSRRLKSAKFAILHNTTASMTPYMPLKCGHQPHQQQIYSHPYNDEDIQWGNNRFNRTIEIQARWDSNLTTAITTTTMMTTMAAKAMPQTVPIYKVRFRLNRKFGMIAQISGFYTHKEKVYELCPKETNCEQREYNAIRAKRDSLEFSKLKFNTTYLLKPFGMNVAGSKDTMSSFTFITPKCESFSKRFPKMQIKC